MKVALWGSYGISKYPKGFKFTSKDIMKVREELAKYLENNVTEVIPMENYTEESVLRSNIKKSEFKCKALLYKNSVRYYVINEQYLCYWYITDIDTSKYWMFSEYDGAEGISYYQLSENNELVRLID